MAQSSVLLKRCLVQHAHRQSVGVEQLTALGRAALAVVVFVVVDDSCPLVVVVLSFGIVCIMSGVELPESRIEMLFATRRA